MAAAFLAASPAAAEPFADFVEFCLRTNGEQNAVAGSAMSAGWISFPAELMFGEEQVFENPKVYLSEEPEQVGDKEFPRDLGVLVTGSMSGATFDVATVKFDACVVVVGGEGAGEPLRQRLETMLGFESRELNGQQAWVFSRVGQSYQPETSWDGGGDLAETVRHKKLYVVAVMDEGGFTGIFLGALRPQS